MTDGREGTVRAQEQTRTGQAYWDDIRGKPLGEEGVRKARKEGRRSPGIMASMNRYRSRSVGLRQELGQSERSGWT